MKDDPDRSLGAWTNFILNTNKINNMNINDIFDRWAATNVEPKKQKEVSDLVHKFNTQYVIPIQENNTKLQEEVNTLKEKVKALIHPLKPLDEGGSGNG